MLIISTVKETPSEKSQSLARAIYLMPGVICAFLLATSGVYITLDTTDTTIITEDNVQELTVFTQQTTSVNKIELLDPVWWMIHYMIGIVLIIYIITQILALLGKK